MPGGGPPSSSRASPSERTRRTRWGKAPAGFSSLGGEGRTAHWDEARGRGVRGDRLHRAGARAPALGAPARARRLHHRHRRRPPRPRGRASSGEADAYLLALPHGVSATLRGAAARRSGPTRAVIDLSGDLRLPTAGAYREWYGHDHPAPELLGAGALRPAPRSTASASRGARLVSNPGCYATSVLLPARAAAARRPRRRRRRRGGRQERRHRRRPHAARGPALLRGGRRLLRLLARAAPTATWARWRRCSRTRTGREVALTFCPHLLPVKRGILSALYLQDRARAPGELARGAAPLLRGRAVRARRGRRAAAALRRGGHERLPHLRPRRPRRDAWSCSPPSTTSSRARPGQAIQNLNLALGWPRDRGPARHGTAGDEP